MSMLLSPIVQNQRLYMVQPGITALTRQSYHTHWEVDHCPCYIDSRFFRSMSSQAKDCDDVTIWSSQIPLL